MNKSGNMGLFKYWNINCVVIVSGPIDLPYSLGQERI